MINGAYILGRILIPIVFIVMGVQKALGIDDFARLLADTGMPLPAEIDGYLGGMSRWLALAYFVAGLEVIAGLLILLGILARWGAIVLIVYAGCRIFFVHHFWDMPSPAAADQLIPALLFVSAIGGLLLIVAGRPQADRLEPSSM